jgi:hypothetical protein
MPSWALVLQAFLPASDVTVSKVAFSLVIMRGPWTEIPGNLASASEAIGKYPDPPRCRGSFVEGFSVIWGHVIR